MLTQRTSGTNAPGIPRGAAPRPSPHSEPRGRRWRHSGRRSRCSPARTRRVRARTASPAPPLRAPAPPGSAQPSGRSSPPPETTGHNTARPPAAKSALTETGLPRPVLSLPDLSRPGDTRKEAAASASSDFNSQHPPRRRRRSMPRLSRPRPTAPYGGVAPPCCGLSLVRSARI